MILTAEHSPVYLAEGNPAIQQSAIWTFDALTGGFNSEEIFHWLFDTCSHQRVTSSGIFFLRFPSALMEILIRTGGNCHFPHRKKNIRCKQSPFAFYTFPFLWLEIRSDLQPICGLFQLLLEFRNSEFNPTNAIKSLRFRAIRNKNLVVDISINCGNLNN